MPSLNPSDAIVTCLSLEQLHVKARDEQNAAPIAADAAKFLMMVMSGLGSALLFVFGASAIASMTDPHSSPILRDRTTDERVVQV